jgi:hypothetical protein
MQLYFQPDEARAFNSGYPAVAYVDGDSTYKHWNVMGCEIIKSMGPGRYLVEKKV